jgi:hypothetical protein
MKQIAVILSLIVTFGFAGSAMAATGAAGGLAKANAAAGTHVGTHADRGIAESARAQGPK